jgi:hypothetical protein
MSVALQQQPRGNGYVQRAPRSSGLADVLELILDRGLVLDLYVRVSLLGIELLTIDARVVIASIDTYLRFAEAVNRLDLSQAGAWNPAQRRDTDDEDGDSASRNGSPVASVQAPETTTDRTEQRLKGIEMASIKEVQKVADDLEELLGELRSEIDGDGDFERLTQIADQISERADNAAQIFSTLNETLMSRISEITGKSGGGGRSSGSGSSSRKTSKAAS